MKAYKYLIVHFVRRRECEELLRLLVAFMDVKKLLDVLRLQIEKVLNTDR